MKIKVIELANILGINVVTIGRWEKSGRLEPVREDGKKPYFSDKHIELIKQGAVGNKYRRILELKGL